MRAFVYFLPLVLGALLGAWAPQSMVWLGVVLIPALFFCGQIWANSLEHGTVAPARMALAAWANAKFILTGALWLALPIFWLQRGGAMPAALLTAAALSAWLLSYQRMWALPSWLLQRPAQSARLSSLARELERDFWRVGAPVAHAQFWQRGVWVNILDAGLILTPCLILLWQPLAAHRLRSWLSFVLLLLPALSLLRMQWAGIEAAPDEPPMGEIKLESEHRIQPHFGLLDAGDLGLADGGETTDPDFTAARPSVLDLCQAVAKGDNGAIEALLARGADPNERPPSDSSDQRSPLVLAAITGRIPVLKRLIAAGADVNGNSAGLTPLLAATRDTWSGRFDVVMSLLTNGANVRARDAKGVTALHGAACSSDPSLLQLILEAGADVDALDDSGFTPLARAVERGQTENVHALLKAGANVHVEGAFPLAHALALCDQPDQSLIEIILARAPLEALDALGQSAMHRCAREDAAELCEALLEAGVDANTRDPQGQTPLMLAASLGSLRVVQRLSLAKVQSNALDQLGNSALHHAVNAENARVDLIELLLAMGTPPALKNREGLSASELALRAGRWDLARKLSPAGELPTEIEHELDHAGPSEQSPKREQLLVQAAQAGRFGVAQALLKLGPLHQHTHLQILLALGDRLTKEWLTDLRSANLQLGSGELEPKLCALARLVPPPQNAMMLLLEAGASVASDAEGDTPLILVCGAAAELEGARAPLAASPKPELINALLARGCQLAVRDAEQRDALSYAVQWCDLTTVQTLLDAVASLSLAPLDLNVRDRCGQTPLLRALAHPQAAEVVRLLIRHGADPNVAARDGKSARAMALANAQLGLAEVLAWSPSSHPARALRPSDLPELAARGDRLGVLRMLQLGFSIDAFDAAGASALTHACARGERELVEFLIAQGANVSGNGSALTPLAAAVRMRHFEIARRLVELGADVNQASGELTPVSLAAGLLDPEAVALLVELGANLEVAEPTLPPVHALIRAVLAGGDLAIGLEMLQTLIRAGADPDAFDSAARTPVTVLLSTSANTPKYPEDGRMLSLMQRLIALGANVLIRDNHGRTLLHWCCRHVFFQAAALLLDAGADPMAVDEFRKLPVDMTTTLNRHDFAALFRGDSG